MAFILVRMFNRSFDSSRKLLKSHLEVDAQNPDLRIGAEYQGRQHAVYVKRFHKNYKSFVQQVNRDESKAMEAVQQGLVLITVPHKITKFRAIGQFLVDSLEANKVTVPPMDWDALEAAYKLERGAVKKLPPREGNPVPVGRPSAPVWSVLSRGAFPNRAMASYCEYCDQSVHHCQRNAQVKEHLLCQCPGFRAYAAAVPIASRPSWMSVELRTPPHEWQSDEEMVLVSAWKRDHRKTPLITALYAEYLLLEKERAPGLLPRPKQAVERKVRKRKRSCTFVARRPGWFQLREAEREDKLQRK